MSSMEKGECSNVDNSGARFSDPTLKVLVTLDLAWLLGFRETWLSLYG